MFYVSGKKASSRCHLSIIDVNRFQYHFSYSIKNWWENNFFVSLTNDTRFFSLFFNFRTKLLYFSPPIKIYKQFDFLSINSSNKRNHDEEETEKIRFKCIQECCSRVVFLKEVVDGGYQKLINRIPSLDCVYCVFVSIKTKKKRRNMPEFVFVSFITKWKMKYKKASTFLQIASTLFSVFVLSLVFLQKRLKLNPSTNSISTKRKKPKK